MDTPVSQAGGTARWARGRLVLGDGEPSAVPEESLSAAERLARAYVRTLNAERTRRAYIADLSRFLHWCTTSGVDALAARPAQLDAYRRHLELPRGGRTPAASSVARNLSAVSSLYRYAVEQEVLAVSPAAGLRRPAVAEQSQQDGLTRDELRALLAAAADDGPRAEALVTLLTLNGLRIDEALSRDVGHLDEEDGHPVLRLRRKADPDDVCVLAPPTLHALHAYLGGRTSGPLFVTRTGRRLDEPAAWRLVRRLAARVGLATATQVNPHSLRHSFLSTAFDVGVALHEIQGAAGHADSRTTRRYDRSRPSLDRAATYAVSAYLAEDPAEAEHGAAGTP